MRYGACWLQGNLTLWPRYPLLKQREMIVKVRPDTKNLLNSINCLRDSYSVNWHQYSKRWNRYRFAVRSNVSSYLIGSIDWLTGNSLCLIGSVCRVKENDKEMISNLLAFRARLDVMVNTACDGNDSYRYKLKEAFEGFLNARLGSTMLILALY